MFPPLAAPCGTNENYCAIGCVDYEVDLSGSKWCVLSVEMSRGRGANAWQHTQIARQSTKELDHFPLSLRIFFGSLDWKISPVNPEGFSQYSNIKNREEKKKLICFHRYICFVFLSSWKKPLTHLDGSANWRGTKRMMVWYGSIAKNDFRPMDHVLRDCVCSWLKFRCIKKEI